MDSAGQSRSTIFAAEGSENTHTRPSPPDAAPGPTLVRSERRRVLIHPKVVEHARRGVNVMPNEELLRVDHRLKRAAVDEAHRHGGDTLTMRGDGLRRGAE